MLSYILLVVNSWGGNFVATTRKRRINAFIIFLQTYYCYGCNFFEKYQCDGMRVGNSYDNLKLCSSKSEIILIVRNLLTLLKKNTSHVSSFCNELKNIHLTAPMKK